MKFKLFTLLACLTLAACGGLRTFHEYARAGDTVAVPVGMQPGFSKDNITVTITPSSGADIVLNATDPAIRAILNLYPDPVSNMIISREIDENTSPGARDYAFTLGSSSNFDKDWYQTTVFIDLPPTLPEGLTQIEINNSLGASHTITLDVIPGTGSANNFNSDFNGGFVLLDAMLDSLSRASHTTVTLESGIIPHAIELMFTHDPDKTVDGAGKAFVVNPLGYRKNLTWSDDGINLKIIMTQSVNGIIDTMNDYKFYISGNAGNLQLVSINGYDSNGNEIAGITPTLTNNN